MNDTLITALTLLPAYTPPSGGTQPPGTENFNTIVQWIIWGVSALLFVFFIVGLVSAANARNRGGQADAAAPVWPLVCAIVLGAAGTIWAMF
ncbi:hypothetical protein [Pseudoclavibacter helvolus]|uniref:hypothetical protein n=1 Tax=Pseudoclavibacter helvolus TaxID=255205 RepID=UPI0024AE3B1E|nr:hypothetical protein [Pseudoclavibacter helvolus]